MSLTDPIERIKTEFLFALNRTKKPGEIYQGTAPRNEVATRRARNKAAARSRRANRAA